ncbi:MAG: acetylxylan esterase [Prevotellaceae bacterium]|jgi:hypothetical protein|nr:acetylxylan esterase [Prevotellaceae bacterium]
MKKLYILFIFCFLCFSISAQKEWNVLPYKAQNLFNNYLLGKIHEQYDSRTTLLNSLQTKAEAEKYALQKRQDYLELLGQMPERTELNPQTTGKLTGNGFVIEKVIYESFPKHYVTANLYLPETKGKHPAVLFLCGHSDNGKAEPEYQQAAQLLARYGFVVLVVDPVSQGERMQLTDKDGKPLERGGTTEHTLLNAGSLLVGESVPKYELWDNIRSLDYLVSRSEVDGGKIAVFGSSGGGTQAMFMMIADPRVKAGIVCSIFSQHERNFELEGASDGCRHLAFEGKKGLEIADQVIAFAPKPVLIMAGRNDFIDFEGVKRGFRQVSKIYDLLGAARNAELLATNDGHGVSKEKREKMTGFLLRHLCGKSTLVNDMGSKIYARGELNCTVQGQVNAAFSDAENVASRNLALAQQYETQRTRFAGKNNDAVSSAKIKELLGIDYQGNITTELIGKSERENYFLEKWIVHAKGEMPLPCLLFVPQNMADTVSVMLYTSGEGKAAITETAHFQSLLKKGNPVLLFDMRGMGETADNPQRNDKKYRNAEYTNAVQALHIGKPLVGQRVVDVLMALDFVQNNKILQNRTVELFAKGACAIPAFHAVFLDKRIEKANLETDVPNWQSIIENPLMHNQFTYVVPNVLKYYDMDDLLKTTPNVSFEPF